MTLTTIAIVVASLALVVGLYRFFYRERDTGGTDDRNWVNDSNYNIATSDTEAEVLAEASAREAEHIVEVNQDEGPFPPSDQEYEILNDKLGDGRPKDTGSVREQLREV